MLGVSKRKAAVDCMAGSQLGCDELLKAHLDASVVIFTTGMTDKAMEVRSELAMAREGIPHVRKSQVVDVNVVQNGRALKRIMKDRYGVSKFPVVFVGRKYIGGLKEVQNLSRLGLLRGMIEKAVVAHRKQRYITSKTVPKSCAQENSVGVESARG